MEITSGLLIYISAFVAIWLGAGLIIRSVDKISHRLRVSSFAIAFFVLGLLTSIPETAVSINAVVDRTPEIFVGTLLGGTAVIFLLIIPLLAIFGNGVKLNHDLSRNNLIGLLAVISAPGLVIIDHKVTNFEGLMLIIAYLIIFFLIQKKHGFINKSELEEFTKKAFSFTDLVVVGLGIGIVLVSSQFIVNQTIAYGDMLKVSPFFISLIVLSFGTNLPELSLALRAVISGKKTIAFGDYLGSAAANTLLFGIFTLVNDGEVFTFNSFFVTFLFIVTGLVMFYYFSQSKKDISAKEGAIMLTVYFAFLIFELSKGFFG